MEGHERNLYLYDRLNARVAGVSTDNPQVLRHWADSLGLSFPLLSNQTAYLGIMLGAMTEPQPTFARRTVVIDRRGVLRYARDGSPDYHEILLLLKQLNSEEKQP